MDYGLASGRRKGSEIYILGAEGVLQLAQGIVTPFSYFSILVLFWTSKDVVNVKGPVKKVIQSNMIVSNRNGLIASARRIIKCCRDSQNRIKEFSRQEQARVVALRNYYLRREFQAGNI